MDFTRLFDIPYFQLKNSPLDKSIGGKKDGKWQYYSTQEFIDTACKVSHGLLKLGVKPGDKIALATYKNRPEWSIMDLAIQQIGAINVPVYPTISPREYEYIFNDSSVSYAFVGAGDLYDKVKAAQQSVDSLKDIYTFDQRDGAKNWEELFIDGDNSVIESIMAGIKPDELATIIYTSGTTGNPKGVMLSHNNIVSNIKAVYDLVPVEKGERALSFLPLCHIFERNVSYSYIVHGATICYTGTDNLGGDDGDLKAIKPHFFTTVPRLLEKVYEKIYNKGLELTGVKKKLFFWALSLTEDYVYDKEYSGLAKIQRNIADKLIFSKWREALGGNVKGIVTGAAKCPEKMCQVFSAAGVPIREGYGLTETSPALNINSFEKGGALMGTVGPTVPGVEIKIDRSDTDFEYKPEEGEIIAKGPNIMMGYHNNPEATAKVIDPDGWFHTGDIGKFIEKDGVKFLKITDRKKELLKTSGGKYVAPAPIESRFKEDFLIEQMMVVGEKQKFVSALIVPAAEALKSWCDDNGVPCELVPHPTDSTLNTVSTETLSHPDVIAKFQSVIDRYNPEFSHIEQIKKFKLLAASWDVSTGELTPTMKLKRRVIREKHGADIAEIYNV